MHAVARKPGKETSTSPKISHVPADSQAVNPLWRRLAARVSNAGNIEIQRKPAGEEGQPPENQAPEELPQGDQGWLEWGRETLEGAKEWVESWRCDTTKNTPPGTPLTVNIPQIECTPEPVALEAIVSDRKSTNQPLGVTSAKAGGWEFGQALLSGMGFCSYALNATPALEFEKMLYTRANPENEAYDFGEEKAGAGECEGKTIPRKIRITEPLAEKIRQGEVEHCNDYKLAFALSYGKYVQALQEMVDNGLCGSDCDAAMTEYFKARTGVEFDNMDAAALTTLEKTGLRDSRGWHSVNLYQGEDEYGKDCSSVTYTPDAGQMTNIGTMSSEELISGQKAPPNGKQDKP